MLSQSQTSICKALCAGIKELLNKSCKI